jgi:hypothetical protein
MIIKDGESMLIYNSNDTRPNERDVVLVFSHSKVGKNKL